MGLSTAELRRRGEVFRELHRTPGVFVLANAWDAGTARVLADAGFPALATSSAAVAQSLGLADGRGLVTREEALANAAAVVAATDLPVSGDLEGGYGSTAAEVAETIRLAARTGLVGASVEDAVADPATPIRPVAEAAERVRAAAEAAASLDFPFTLTARAENFLHGRPDLDDTIDRLRAYAAAGADVLFAPGLPDAEAIRRVCAAVDRPVNVLPASATQPLTLPELAELGVRRVSLGSTLARAALGAVLDGAREITEEGTFGYAARAPRNANSLFAEKR
ncbi:isocitrate lyase/PEP mutase family protein [Streptomyces alkaliterrae]|uniref:Isocitrate lyase/phosphoenolpyruvate mutase family protein n=1 Tax=Streptomyces alkaliterrae TaxID=2213162 RepID=A0A5P0YML2_9ACTN|nr:isocitrate lyase/phosphoenolpyruvate mutase family protein [Streptomyces alkaliterrae]MBB1255092.1 isocitrate lyase/phosphoenolpyruvate mutase family protein [Streptomyces alkaliterrae]MBB1260758.1 isocitrate lyase/phosphoenolpyruvate mutase family protein [Streptomyces alkaliterrae]MQS01545.1 isocitrate lyase/phosphoenolpyruvate mutase family protein [Streptomyces alkaliterrae]